MKNQVKADLNMSASRAVFVTRTVISLEVRTINVLIRGFFILRNLLISGTSSDVVSSSSKTYSVPFGNKVFNVSMAGAVTKIIAFVVYKLSPDLYQIVKKSFLLVVCSISQHLLQTPILP